MTPGENHEKGNRNGKNGKQDTGKGILADTIDKETQMARRAVLSRLLICVTLISFFCAVSPQSTYAQSWDEEGAKRPANEEISHVPL